MRIRISTGLSESVEGTCDADFFFIEDVGVDHGGADV